MSLNEALRTDLTQKVNAHRVVLFMKGKRRLPQCGFSAQVVKILDELVDDYQTYNVLDDPDLRNGIKEFSSWPTIPQLYVDGSFIGGCDIVSEMYKTGQLHEALGLQVPEVHPPKLSVSEAAQAQLVAALEGAEGQVRLEVDQNFRPTLGLDQVRPGDFEVEAGALRILVDRMSAPRADGVHIDFTTDGGGGFRVDNPNEPAKVRSARPQDVHARLVSGERFEFIDVRTPEERQTAQIQGTTLLTPEEMARLEALPKDTPLVFHCHHGGRSLQAAQAFVDKGFSRVYNMDGGIDAWSLHIDNSIPRY
ncbi:MAG: Grx4 family monothiol glutaredoxin [Myxococcota bacterium]